MNKNYQILLNKKKNNKHSIIILLDNVRSMNNVGSIFRISDAFQVKKIFLCGISPTPPHRKIQKTALGATELVDWEYHNNIFTLIQNLKLKKKYKIIGIEQVKNSNMLYSYQIKKKKYVLIFGNEIEGISSNILHLIDDFIEIPQSGIKKSLNVSISLGIVLWEFYKIFTQT